MIWTRKRMALGAGALCLCVILGFFAHKPALLEEVSFSRRVTDRSGSLMRLTLARDEAYRLYVPLRLIAPELKEAVLLYEDQHYYRHGGINPLALVRAFVQTYFTAGRRVGASTITMQLARLRFGINTRHLPGKLWQILRAVQLELHYSKDELFEAYLNLAPFGGNIEGVGAASQIYFNRNADALTLPEALTLAVIPQSPRKRAPTPQRPGAPELLAARSRLFDRWVEAHPQDRSYAPLMALPLAVKAPRDVPFEAPHAVVRLLREHPSARDLASTIDLPAQHLLERFLMRYVAAGRSVGIHNAAALLVDVRSMEVRAAIGSADFFNPAIQGQVDGTRARRSPGSVLKPLLYALAFEQGIIHPLSLMKDAPTRFGTYNPENFDRDFRGPVSARDALMLSRNIPALTLMTQLKPPGFYGLLRRAGIGKLRDEASYGLSLVLGGAEVTMEEVAALYAMLAQDGRFRPLVWSMDGQAAPGDALLTPEAAFLALDALKATARPLGAQGLALPVYWKTGTSNGFRDAWTAGVFGHYALVVWVGDFRGKSNPAYIGVRSAAPLFFDIAAALAQKESLEDQLQQKRALLKLREVTACATTGDIDDPYCPAQARTLFIPGISPIRPQRIYRRVLVDYRTGERDCRLIPGITEYRVLEFWPSDLLETLRRAGIHKPPLPPLKSYCRTGRTAGQGQQAEAAPVITSPSPHLSYSVRVGDAQPSPLSFIASAEGGVETLYWFVDGALVGSSAPSTPLYWAPKPGRFTLRVVDDKARAQSMTLDVQAAE